MQSIREKLECVTKSSQKLHFGRVLSVLIFVGMIVGGGSYVRPIIKVYLLVACVCVCV